MIVGVGIDVVDIARFAALIARVPGVVERTLTPQERDQPVASLAVRFAAKEALAKALQSPGNLAWHDAWILPTHGKPPQLHIQGTVDAAAKALGVNRFHVSLSHDQVATAIVIAER